jgi:AraC-like DNA-binding protein
MPEPTYAAGYAVGLVDFAVSRGADRSTLVALAGLDPALLDDHFKRVPLSRYMALLRNAATLCDDPAVALHFGQSSNCTDLSIIAMIGASCDTVSEALAHLNRYCRLALDIDGVNNEHYLLEHAREGVWLIDGRQLAYEYAELSVTTFTRMICTARLRFGREIARAVHFRHDAPPYAAECDALLGVTVRYNAPRSAILLDPAWLTQRIAQSPRYALAVLTARADELMAELEASRTVRGRVERAVAQLLATGGASMEVIAESMAMSRATLYRALKAEGVTFEGVLDDVRHRTALEHLSTGKLSVHRVAYLTGFSDPAAFSRAFKRWTGRSPREAARSRMAS